MPIFNKYLDLDGIEELQQFFIEKGIIQEYLKNEFLCIRGKLKTMWGSF